jgi:thymidine kinase
MGFREARRYGHLEVITGCMFSGKTKELLRRLERLVFAKLPYILIKPTIDDRRNPDTVSTHDEKEFPAQKLEPGQETMANLISVVGAGALDRADTVAFDEGNFFSEKLPGLVNDLVDRGKRVIVAGLDMTFTGEPFGPMPQLLALAKRVDKLQAVCLRCGADDATMTQRLIDGRPAPIDGPTIQVGGSGSYESRCLACWNR